jgi:hypothetical protein
MIFKKASISGVLGLNIMVTKVIFDLYKNFKIFMRRMNLSCFFRN